MFFIKVLRQSHEKRYKLLLEHDVIGDLSDRNEDCDCFDICTVPKILTWFQINANLMNKQTFERIIQFAVRSDRKDKWR